MKMRSPHWLLLSGLLLSAAGWAEEARTPVPAPMRDTAGDVVRPAADGSAAVYVPPDAAPPVASANETEPGKGGEPVVARREKAQQDPFLLLLLQILRTPK